MERERKVCNKKEEFLGVKLKQRGILVGKRGGNSTPSPTWRFGLPQTDDAASLEQDLTFPSNFTTTVSARKLAANLWEVQPQREVVKMRKAGPRPHHHKHKDKGFEVPNMFDEPPDRPLHQPTSASNFRRHVAKSSTQNHQPFERNGHALEPVSRGSSSSMEMAPYGQAISPTGSLQYKGKFGESSYNLRTSTELLKVLNRIWSLEEQQRSNDSVVKAMKKKLDHSRVQLKALLKEKKRDHQEMENLMKQLSEDKVLRKNKGQDEIQEEIYSLRNELEDERKLRKHSESLHRKLARELAGVKSSHSGAVKELERERKARILLEDLCDEFAKGITDYEHELRILKHKSEKDFNVQEHTDRLILHISEAWLDERMQMKLAEAGSGLQDKKTVLDKLSLEIETFLQAKQSGSLQNNDVLSSKKPSRSTLGRTSLESFHLNEVGSAPQNGNDEEDSAVSDLSCCEGKRGHVQEQGYGSTKQRDHSLRSEGRKHQNENEHVQDSIDPSSFAGPINPVDRWTSKVMAPVPEVSESTSTWFQGIKENTLKAKLLEARLESQQSRARTSRGV